MRLRLQLFAIEAELFGFFLIEALLSRSVPSLVPFIYLSSSSLLLTLGGWAWWPLTALGAFSTAFIYHASLNAMYPAEDKPIRERLSAFPAFQTEVRNICREFRMAAPNNVKFVLSPISWQPFGCNLHSGGRRDVVVPVGCLEIWSIFDLRCYVAHSLLRRRAPKWLFMPLRNVFIEPGASNRRKARLLRLMIKWNVIADLDADRRVAKLYGPFLVEQLIRHTAFAYAVVAYSISRFLEPLCRRGVLLPVAGSCAMAWERCADAPAVREYLRSRPKLLQIRLLALSAWARGAEVCDSRPASSLFDGLAAIEERAIRNEMKLPREQILRRAAIRDVQNRTISRRAEADDNAL